MSLLQQIDQCIAKSTVFTEFKSCMQPIIAVPKTTRNAPCMTCPPGYNEAYGIDYQTGQDLTGYCVKGDQSDKTEVDVISCPTSVSSGPGSSEDGGGQGYFRKTRK